MIKKTLNTVTGESHVYLGESFSEIEKYIPLERTIMVVDKEVMKLHGHTFPDVEVITIDAEESKKDLSTVEYVYERMMENEIDRDSFLIGVGGGITCDIAGFAASTYMRGISFALVPTTLLAQVDAAIGGKNGVNFKGYKNMIGNIEQPDLVLIDHSFLQTLPDEEIRTGMAEIIKAAVIGSSALFHQLELNKDEIMSLEPGYVDRVVRDAVDVKMRIVARDEFESGERRKLNFGHTFGHAVEKNYPITHGKAVALGMGISVDMSVERGSLHAEDGRRVKRLIDSYGFSEDVDLSTVFEAIKKDKKRSDDVVKFVLLNAIGSAEIVDIPLSEIEKVCLDDH